VPFAQSAVLQQQDARGSAAGMSLPRKRSKSLSLSEGLLRKLNQLWYEEVKKSLNMDERLSFSEFIEELLWDAIKIKKSSSKNSSEP
jgi:hypothetical protein